MESRFRLGTQVNSASVIFNTQVHLLFGLGLLIYVQAGFRVERTTRLTFACVVFARRTPPSAASDVSLSVTFFSCQKEPNKNINFDGSASTQTLHIRLQTATRLQKFCSMQDVEMPYWSKGLKIHCIPLPGLKSTTARQLGVPIRFHDHLLFHFRDPKFMSLLLTQISQTHPSTYAVFGPRAGTRCPRVPRVPPRKPCRGSAGRTKMSVAEERKSRSQPGSEQPNRTNGIWGASGGGLFFLESPEGQSGTKKLNTYSIAHCPRS